MAYAFSNLLGDVHTAGKIHCVNGNVYSIVHNRIRVMNVQTNTSITLPYEARYRLKRFTITDNERYIFAVDNRNKGYLISVESGSCLCRMSVGCVAKALCFNSDASILAVSSSRIVHIWATPLQNIRAGIITISSSKFELLNTISCSTHVASLRFTPDELFLLIAGSSNSVKCASVLRPTHPLRLVLSYNTALLEGHSGGASDAFCIQSVTVPGQLHEEVLNIRTFIKDPNMNLAEFIKLQVAGIELDDEDPARTEFTEEQTTNISEMIDTYVKLDHVDLDKAARGALASYSIVTVSRRGFLNVWAPGIDPREDASNNGNDSDGNSGGSQDDDENGTRSDAASAWSWHIIEKRDILKDTKLLYDKTEEKRGDDVEEGSGEGSDECKPKNIILDHDGNEIAVDKLETAKLLDNPLIDVNLKPEKVYTGYNRQRAAEHASTIIISVGFGAENDASFLMPSAGTVVLSFADGHYSLYSFDILNFRIALTRESLIADDVLLWNEQNPKSNMRISHFKHIHNLKACTYPITSVCVHKNYLMMACRHDHSLHIFDYFAETFVLQELSPPKMTCTAVSENNEFYAIGCVNGAVYIYNSVSGFLYATVTNHLSAVTKVRFSKTSRVLISAGADGLVFAFDLTKKKTFRRLSINTKIIANDLTSLTNSISHGIIRSFSALAVDPSGDIIAVGCSDGDFEVYLFQLRTSKLLEVLSGHTGPITSLCFSPLGTGELASTSWDGTIRVWSTFATNIPCEILEEGVEVLQADFTPDGMQLLTSTSNGRITIWSVENGEQIGIFNVGRDILGGFKDDEHRHYMASAYGKSCKSFCIVGDYLICAGDSKYIIVYSYKSWPYVLMAKYQITIDKGIAGVRKRDILDKHTGEILDKRVSDSSDIDAGEIMRDLTILTKIRDRESRRVVDSLQQVTGKRLEACVIDICAPSDGMRFLALTPFGALEYTRENTRYNKYINIADIGIDVTVDKAVDILLSCYKRDSGTNTTTSDLVPEAFEQANMQRIIYGLQITVALHNDELFKLYLLTLYRATQLSTHLQNTIMHAVKILDTTYYRRFIGMLSQFIRKTEYFSVSLAWAQTFVVQVAPILEQTIKRDAGLRADLKFLSRSVALCSERLLSPLGEAVTIFQGASYIGRYYRNCDVEVAQVKGNELLRLEREIILVERKREADAAEAARRRHRYQF